LKIGNLIFIELVPSPKADELPSFLDNHRLLTFLIPENLLQVKASSPTVSPLEQTDNIFLVWDVDSDDILVSMSISYEVETCLDFESSCQFSSNLSSWYFSNLENPTDTSVSDGRFSLLNMSQKKSSTIRRFTLLVPFTLIERKCLKENSEEKVSGDYSLGVLFYIEYSINRNGCTMNCSATVRCEVRGERAVCISVEPYDFEIDKQGDLYSIYLQVALKNNFPISLILDRPKLSCSTLTHKLSVIDIGGMEPILSEGVILHSMEYLYLPLKVVFDRETLLALTSLHGLEEFNKPKYVVRYRRMDDDSVPIEFQLLIPILSCIPSDMCAEKRTLREKVYYNLDVFVEDSIIENFDTHRVVLLCYKVTVTCLDIVYSPFKLYLESVESEQWLPIGKKALYLSPTAISEENFECVKCWVITFVHQCKFLCLKSSENLNPPDILVDFINIESLKSRNEATKTAAYGHCNSDLYELINLKSETKTRISLGKSVPQIFFDDAVGLSGSSRVLKSRFSSVW
jgi:hypothetical protein